MRKIGNKLRTKRQRLRKTQRKYKKQNRRTGRKQNRRTKRAMRGGLNANGGKVMVLIIDPQNDFSDNMDPVAPLQVPGAVEDYKRICTFITKNTTLENDKIDEIHVSLDTHTLNHIGHAGFWRGIDDKNLHPSPMTIMRYEDGKIIGKNGSDEKEFIPVNPALSKYAVNYIESFTSSNNEPPFNFPLENRHQQLALIWPTHCIEGTPGHEVHAQLKSCLDKPEIAPKVHYHIKGQNNLAEMYSIFSASKTPNSNDIFAEATDGIFKENMYVDGEKVKLHDLTMGSPSYDDVKLEVNLHTEFNKAFADHLIGDFNNPNTIYVCGEAKSHCVRSSLKDLRQYVLDKYLTAVQRTKILDNIIVLDDCTSPVTGFEFLGNLGELLDEVAVVNKGGEVLAKGPTDVKSRAMKSTDITL